MQNSSVVILAAGKGSRMLSNLPKVLHKISGISMLAHLIKKARQISDDVVVVVGHESELVASKALEIDKNVRIHKQDIKRYPGTAGALFELDFKSENILVVAGDMPLISAEVFADLAKSKADITLCAFSAPNPFGYGRVILDESGNVKKIVEQKDASPSEQDLNLVNAGAYSFKLEALKKILPLIDNKNASSEYYLTHSIAIARQLGLEIKMQMVDKDEFMGVNDKFQLATAENIMQDKIKQKLMQNGVIMHLPSTIYIDYETEFVGECELESGVIIKGKSKISQSKILAHSVVEDAEIHNSQIGPMARVRPKSIIKDSKIGNFVETKAAQLNGVKAGHLSYLGDCEIDSGTNISCGVITCNYDGKNKHKTIIGKNAFIGSNVNLIAPIKIGEAAFIAAGSSLSKDVLKAALAIERAPLKIVDGYGLRLLKKDSDE